ncbi:hypothetical protein [Microbacterium lacusdiani]
MIRKSLVTTTATAALALGLVFAGTGAASAHECYVVKRSDQGSVGAAHSGNWFYVQLSELFLSAPGEIGVPPLTDSQLAWALAEADARGVPDSFALFGRFTIPKGDVPEYLLSDAKGIDRFFDAHIETVIAIYMEALTMR